MEDIQRGELASTHLHSCACTHTHTSATHGLKGGVDKMAQKVKEPTVNLVT